MQISTWQWTLPEVTTHQGTSIGAAAAASDRAPQLCVQWETLLTDETAEVEAWPMCSCGWSGPHLPAAVTRQLAESGRAAVEDFGLMREQWEKHARQDHGAGRGEDAELRRAAELFRAWTRRDPATALRLLRGAGHLLSGQTADTVAQARLAGLSWAAIAEPLAVTKAAAYERFKAIDPIKQADR